ncbi:MAG TPA: TonB-dependent receptor [Bryobacteraceae bacterium]|nr:TonB-dependent receptor [Bryobacteraceae bacterium]
MSFRLSTSAAAYWILTGAAAFAQSNQGTITGTIADPAGAVIAGATIEVRNADTGVVYQGGSSNTGNYVIPVPAGTYQITVSVPGFKRFVESNVQVVVATDTRKDITLAIGEASEAVTVADTAPLLKTESGEMSHLVEVNEVDQIPLLTVAGGGYAGATQMGNIRNPLQTSLLLPGVAFANDMELVVNGLPSNSETIRIEGQDSTGTLWKVYQQRSQTMGVDAVQEVNVQTSNFAAEYGQAGGGYFNFTMKSGTNQLHGSAYDYFVNEALNAGLPFTDAGAVNPTKEGQHIRNANRKNDFGGTIGGPIRIPKIYNGKDRSFFFFNFEQYRQSLSVGNGVMSVPTQAYRNGNFGTAGCLNFNGATNTCNGGNTPLTNGGAPVVDSAGQALTYGEIFDPATTHIVNGYNVRTPFPNNTIPLSRFDPTALMIQNMLPLPNAPGIINNFIIPDYLNWTHTTDYSWKIDHSLSPTAKLSWYLSRYGWNSPNATGVPGPFSGQAATGYRNLTTRVNFDYTVKPTLLFHLGIGYLHQFEPTIPQKFDESSLGMHGYYDETLFPTIFGMGQSTSGGWACSSSGAPCGATTLFGNTNGVGGAFETRLYEEKSTGNTSLTWVHGNHIYKFGGETTIEGYPNKSHWRANGTFIFSNAETADPWQNGQPMNFTNGTGFNYASFLLGTPDSFQLSPIANTKLGNHFFGLYAQDSWKVTRKFTLDYGLRYDYQTYLNEQYNRMQEVSWSTPNPAVGGLLGTGIYQGAGPGAHCNCQFSHVYPYAFGPRLGAAYQINPKTVLRAGAGVMYGTTQTPQGLSYGVADYYTFNSLGYGITPMPLGLSGPNPDPNLTFPNFSPGKYPTASGGLLPPSNPNIYFSPEARPPRIMQWSIGVQREVQKDIVLEVTYVGNREVWGAAPGLDQINSNSLTPAILAAHGLNIANPATQKLLTSLLSSPQAAAAGFYPAYAGMPLTQTVAQDLRPAPQFTLPTAEDLGPPIGKTWYDSLQSKVTKRLSHGLSVQGSFVWSKGLVNGTGAEAGNITTLAGIPIYNDIYNYGINKQLNQLVRPDAAVISGTYTTPKIASADSGGMKALSQVVRDWQIGWVLRYQNGALIQAPYSNNQLNQQLERASPTFWNRVPGANPLLVNPNCGCFNPQTTLVLNPAAWTDAPGGTFGTSAPFYDNYRWQRQPAESVSFGRNFRFGKEGRFNFYIRAEFQNIFNRLFLSPPLAGSNSPANPTANANPASSPTVVGGVYTYGYGYIPTLNGAGAQPRSGQIVGRFTF